MAEVDDFKDPERAGSSKQKLSDEGRGDGRVDGDGHVSDSTSVVDAQTYAYSEDRKIGVTGAVFLILNKMIGTGSELIPRLHQQL